MLLAFPLFVNKNLNKFESMNILTSKIGVEREGKVREDKEFTTSEGERRI